MRYYNCELPKEEAAALKAFLKKEKIYYEASGCYGLVHFEVLISEGRLDYAGRAVSAICAAGRSEKVRHCKEEEEEYDCSII